MPQTESTASIPLRGLLQVVRRHSLDKPTRSRTDFGTAIRYPLPLERRASVYAGDAEPLRSIEVRCVEYQTPGGQREGRWHYGNLDLTGAFDAD